MYVLLSPSGTSLWPLSQASRKRWRTSSSWVGLPGMRSRQPTPRIACTVALSSLRIASVSAVAASSAVAKCFCLSILACFSACASLSAWASLSACALSAGACEAAGACLSACACSAPVDPANSSSATLQILTILLIAVLLRPERRHRLLEHHRLRQHRHRRDGAWHG